MSPRWFLAALGAVVSSAIAGGAALVGANVPGPAGAVLAHASPLVLSARSVGPGDTLAGTVTLANATGVPISVARIVLAVRPPGGSKSGGPFLDLAPSLGPTTVAAGAKLRVQASRRFTTADAPGAYWAYATFEDDAGIWHDGDTVHFTVVASPRGTPSGSAAASPSSRTASPAPVASPASSPASSTPAPSRPRWPGLAGPYTVRGNAILDASGQRHLFHGVDRPSLEWSSTGVALSPGDYALMASWNANVVRIALDQDFWLAGARRHDPGYTGLVDAQVAWAHAAGLDVILDLHWSDRGDLSTASPGQQRMPDVNSLELWREVAARYANDPGVLFELYNEPHDVSWDVWLSGGPTGEGWDAVGMQDLADAVRAAGATNVVLVGGLDWAYDLSQVPGHRVQGTNVAYATHVYESFWKAPTDWDSAWGSLAATDPIVVTEFGTTDGSTNYYDVLIAYCDARAVSWTGWAWYPGGITFPALVTDWNGTPSPAGAVVKAALAGY